MNQGLDMRETHGPLDSRHLWSVFTLVFIVLLALLLLTTTAVR